MNGRPLPGAVERPFDAPRFSPDEFVAAVFPSQEEGESVPSEVPVQAPLLVRLALEAAR